MSEQQNKPIQKSNCCEAPISVKGGGEGTYHYECEKCGNSCDPIYATIFTPQQNKGTKYCTCNFIGKDNLCIHSEDCPFYTFPQNKLEQVFTQEDFIKAEDFDPPPLTMEERFVEGGADLEHDRWARWQKYFFSHCQFKPQGEVGGMDDRYVYFALPKDLYEMWVRKIKTPYAELTEQEKESDRKETRNYLPLVSYAVSRALKEQRDTILKLIDKYYLQYCREQNGLDHCKNCGLNIEELKKLLSNNKE